MATRDLPGVPPVPPSDMDPSMREHMRKRLVAVERSRDAVIEEISSIDKTFPDVKPAFIKERYNYLLGRERKFNADLAEIRKFFPEVK